MSPTAGVEKKKILSLINSILEKKKDYALSEK